MIISGYQFISASFVIIPVKYPTARQVATMANILVILFISFVFEGPKILKTFQALLK
ncbi:hypothetical protein FEM08_28920 [Flavobacterium gilvum]|nr:hypothetical protein FEM08_28920 [Flavobacterium gilvum]